jgi:tape measure domain-containing protein
MGKASLYYADSSSHATKRSWLMNQALFTMRRLTYGATLGFIGAATGAAMMGIQFDIMRQNSQIAFETLLGSAQAASKEVQFLFDLAAKTPFEFGNVQQFARQFLGWGFSLQQTNRYLQDFSDVIAAMGGDVSIMDRISLAFGQIRSAGVLLGQDLRQLQQAVPGVSAMLQQQLGLTPRQMANIGALRIPANIAIEAIMRGIEQDPRFKGAAAKLQQSAQGQLSTLHDYAAQLFGDIMQAPFEGIVHALPHLNDDLAKLSKTMHDSGFPAFIRQLDQMTHSGGHLEQVVGVIADTFVQLWRITKILWQSFQDVVKVGILPFILAMWTMNRLLSIAADHSTILRIALDILIARFIYLKTVQFVIWFTAWTLAIWGQVAAWWALTTAEKVNVIAGWAVVGVMRRMLLWIFLAVPELWALVAGEWAYTASLWAAATAQWAWNAALAVATTWVRRALLWILLAVPELWGWAAAAWAGAAAMITGFVPALQRMLLWLLLAVPELWGAAAAAWAFAAALLANPITWIVLGIVALIAVLVVLYFKWQWFHNLVNKTVDFIRNNWPIVIALIAGISMPLALAIGLTIVLIRYFHDLVRWAQKAFDIVNKFKGPSLIDVGNWVDRSVFGNDPNAWAKFKAHATHQQFGGTTFASGWSLVGEQGPEMMWMDKGARVMPLDRGPDVGLMEHDLVADIPVIIKLDSVTIAEALAKVKLKKRARQ